MSDTYSAPLTTGGAHTPMAPPVVRGALYISILFPFRQALLFTWVLVI